jgi:hypothetical protein
MVHAPPRPASQVVELSKPAHFKGTVSPDYSNLNPILHTWFRDSCFIYDGSTTIQVFPLLFNTGMVI